MIVKLNESEVIEAIERYITQQIGKELDGVQLCDKTSGKEIDYVEAVCFVKENE